MVTTEDKAVIGAMFGMTPINDWSAPPADLATDTQERPATQDLAQACVDAAYCCVNGHRFHVGAAATDAWTKGLAATKGSEGVLVYYLLNNKSAWEQGLSAAVREPLEAQSAEQVVASYLVDQNAKPSGPA